MHTAWLEALRKLSSRLSQTTNDRTFQTGSREKAFLSSVTYYEWLNISNKNGVQQYPTVADFLTRLTLQVRAPNDAQFARLWRTRTESHPLQVGHVPAVDPLNLVASGVFTLYNVVLCVSLKKWERFLPHLLHVYSEQDMYAHILRQLDTGTT